MEFHSNEIHKTSRNRRRDDVLNYLNELKVKNYSRSFAGIASLNPDRAQMSVTCGCCVLSGRGLCDELITRPEESYRLWCVIMCDIQTSRMRRPWSELVF